MGHMEYWRDKHRVHLIVYHLIWCPQRRRKYLTGASATDGDRIIRVVCSGQGWEVLELATRPVRTKLPTLWTPSFLASTAGNISADTIQRYIEAQKGT
ncbi:MAG TPA: transposase [Chloroflexia bacterium]|nr:transposase [Chloroflexia bacterium]